MKGPAQTDAFKLEIIHDGRLQRIDQTLEEIEAK